MKKVLKQKGGYAMLFAIVIVSILSVIGAGLSNSSYKQLLLSSLVTDSQIAFYEADTASECGLYQYYVEKIMDSEGPPGDFDCGIDKNKDDYIFQHTPTQNNIKKFYLDDSDERDRQPCLEGDITKQTHDGGLNSVTIKSRGYNLCDKSNIRSVERELEIRLYELSG